MTIKPETTCHARLGKIRSKSTNDNREIGGLLSYPTVARSATMTPNYLHEVMDRLAKKWPIFRNENEFQHRLGEELVNDGYEVEYEREFCVLCNGQKVCGALDIYAKGHGSATAIEVKFKAHQVAIVHKNVTYQSKNNDWGVNMSRFYILKDLGRVGLLVDQGFANCGYSITICNVADAWQRDLLETENAGREFSIHEGRELAKDSLLNWSRPMTEGSVTAAGMPPHVPIRVPCTQWLSWREYSKFGNTGNGVFRYLLLSAMRNEAVFEAAEQVSEPRVRDYGKIRTDAKKIVTVSSIESSICNSPPMLPAEGVEFIGDSELKPLIRVASVADYWGLRIKCDGGNYYGNVSKSSRGRAGIIAFKLPSINHIACQGGNFLIRPGYNSGPSWTGGTKAYVGHVPFDSVSAAFRYLEIHFRICACPEAVSSLREHGVTFIQPCEKA